MRRINFHTFTMGDVDDVEIYVAQPIWVMAHCKDPQYRIGADDNKWGHRVVLYGDLEDKDAMFHQLKWGHV